MINLNTVPRNPVRIESVVPEYVTAAPVAAIGRERRTVRLLALVSALAAPALMLLNAAGLI